MPYPGIYKGSKPWSLGVFGWGFFPTPLSGNLGADLTLGGKLAAFPLPPFAPDYALEIQADGLQLYGSVG